MFRIRRIYDDVLAVNREAILKVQDIWKTQFPDIRAEEIAALSDRLKNPVKHRFRAVLFVAENGQGNVKGFALMMHDEELEFCYLDYIAAAGRQTGRGIGGALYERLRHEARMLHTVGLFFECLPDDPGLCRDKENLDANRARLRFYERYGARPISGTEYETPVNPGDDCPPYLVYDPIDRDKPLRRRLARRIVRAILERKYGDYCPAVYIDRVVTSFTDDPVRMRPPRYVRKPELRLSRIFPAADQKIILVVADQHRIHHIREKGYVESPVRVDAIRKGIEPTGLFSPVKIRRFSLRPIRVVHDHQFVDYLGRVCEKIQSDVSVYPYVFPLRNQTRPPVDLPVRAGYYCMDTFTPIHQNAFAAAKRAVDCALTGARYLSEGHRLAYALVRPPGHHAEKGAFGGFCYFNSASIAANELVREGRVAVLDIDYHHGNGHEDIFWERSDVLTVSIHGNPRFAYPYFTGFRDSKGEGDGKGYNLNFPLPEQCDGSAYRETLDKALNRIRHFAPAYLVLAFGLDTARGDPTGTWSLTARDFEENGRLIGSLRIPTLVVQEGGYDTRQLGRNARSFFTGLWTGHFGGGRKCV
ncbi:MAG TPA: histone deacetylase family protein [bacterium]|nr:histone deacetylase family protein [bacterium]